MEEKEKKIQLGRKRGVKERGRQGGRERDEGESGGEKKEKEGRGGKTGTA